MESFNTNIVIKLIIYFITTISNSKPYFIYDIWWILTPTNSTIDCENKIRSVQVVQNSSNRNSEINKNQAFLMVLNQHDSQDEIFLNLDVVF